MINLIVPSARATPATYISFSIVRYITGFGIYYSWEIYRELRNVVVDQPLLSTHESKVSRGIIESLIGAIQSKDK
jgi:hypothetical protein